MSNVPAPGVFARLNLFPIRLATGWGRPARQLGFMGMTMLVLLRMCIGFHFFSEGVDKLSGDFDAGRFFATARGPLAEQFQGVIWDWDGRVRLDAERSGKFWDGYRDRLVKDLGLKDRPLQGVDRAVATAKAHLENILVSYANEIEEFERGRGRIAALNSDPTRDGVSSLAGQRETIIQDWRKLINPVFTQIDQVWTNLEADVGRAIPASQRLGQSLALGRPRDVLIDTSVINPIVPYFDLLIGACLLLGLFTPVAALAAAGFLGSVFMSQFPPVTGPASTYYHLVESAACLAIAATGAGRFAGLDFFLYAIGLRLWPTHAEQQ